MKKLKPEFDNEYNRATLAQMLLKTLTPVEKILLSICTEEVPDVPKPDPVYCRGELLISKKFAKTLMGDKYMGVDGLIYVASSDAENGERWIMEPSPLPPLPTDPRYRVKVGPDGHPVLKKCFDFKKGDLYGTRNFVFTISESGAQEFRTGWRDFHGFRWECELVPETVPEKPEAKTITVEDAVRAIELMKVASACHCDYCSPLNKHLDLAIKAVKKLGGV